MIFSLTRFRNSGTFSGRLIGNVLFRKSIIEYLALFIRDAMVLSRISFIRKAPLIIFQCHMNAKRCMSHHFPCKYCFIKGNKNMKKIHLRNEIDRHCVQFSKIFYIHLKTNNIKTLKLSLRTFNFTFIYFLFVSFFRPV